MASKANNPQTLFTTNAARIQKTLETEATKLAKLVDSIKDFPQTLPTLAESIEDAQMKLTDLETQFKSRKREFDAELELQIKESKEDVLNNLMTEFGLAKISYADLNSLKDELSGAEQKLADEISSVKAKAESEKHAAISTVKSAADNAQKLAIAELTAVNSNLKDRVEWIGAENDKLRAQIEQIINAHTEQERARSQASGVVVNTASR